MGFDKVFLSNSFSVDYLVSIVLVHCQKPNLRSGIKRDRVNGEMY